MYILKNYQFTHLISSFTRNLKMALNAPETTKFGFPMENWANNMCIVPVLLELRISYFLLAIMGFLMTKCSCLLEMTSNLFKNPKVGFYLKNWPINMCVVFGCSIV